MRGLPVRFACLGVVCAITAPCESLQWDAVLRRALDLQRRQHYAEAESLLTGIIKESERTQPQDARVAVALHNLAEVYQDTGRYADAEKAYLESLSILERSLGTRHPFLVKAGLNDLAELYIETGALAKAKPLLDRALSIADSAPGVDSATRATVLVNLASIQAKRGQRADAENLLQRSLGMYAASPEPLDSRTAAVLNNLAALAAMRNDIPAAMGYAERAVAIMRGHETDEPVQFARALLNHGLLEAKLGSRDTAESEMKQALTVAERAFGGRHPVTATILSGYAVVLRADGRKREAKKMEERAHAIQARSDHENGLGMTIDASALIASAQHGASESRQAQ